MGVNREIIYLFLVLCVLALFVCLGFCMFVGAFWFLFGGGIGDCEFNAHVSSELNFTYPGYQVLCIIGGVF